MKYFLLSLFILVQLSTASSRVSDSSAAETWSFHTQATLVGQAHPGFHAPYSGLNSLDPQSEFKSSLTATAFAGARIWNGGELYCNPELVAGSGFSGTTGIAGFPNGEIFRIGDPHPTITIARLLLRQTFALGPDLETVNPDANQLAGIRPIDRVTITLGKFSVVDQFDDNSYSHDARTQFLDWALMDNGSWDYPADTRGYTWGISVEWHRRLWTLRAYAVMVPLEANGLTMDRYLAKANGEAVELEYQYAEASHPGTIRLAGYINHARMGTYQDALASNPASPDITQSRRYGTSKIGFSFNGEQSVSDNAGVFFRAGWNDGKTETWAFTEIDRTLSLGISLSGAAWSQPSATAGLAFVANGLSPDHRNYLTAGGYGFLIGDGAMSYDSEYITEGYYRQEVVRYLSLSGHLQYVIHPAYNRDRGPVGIFSLRAHVEI